VLRIVSLAATVALASQSSVLDQIQASIVERWRRWPDRSEPRSS